MSLNVTPLSEISRTVLGGVQISVSTANLISGFPILAPNGSLGAPSYSFASNTDSGIFRTDSDGIISSVDGVAGLVAGSLANVGVGAVPSNYGGGEGVVFLADAAVKPVGVPNGGSGGILYVDGPDLSFLDASGTVVSLTTTGGSDVSGPPSSVDNQLVTYSSTLGRIVSDDSGIRYASSQLLVGDGGATEAAYSFISEPSTGMYLSGSAVNFSVLGTSRLSLASTAATFSVPFQNDFPSSAATPAFSFTSSTSSGLFYGSNHVQVSSGGDAGLAVGGSNTHNVAVGGLAADYGTDADGVLFIPTASVVPVGVPNGGSGGVLYVTGAGTELRWLNATGTSVLLGGSVHPVGTVVDGSLAVWTNTSGSSVVPRTVVTDVGAVHAVQSATLANAAYSFSASTTTGLLRVSAGKLGVQGTGDQAFSIDASSITTATTVVLGTSTSTKPGLSFSNHTSSGLFNNGRLSVGGGNPLSVRSPSSVSFCESTFDFGSADGVLRIGEADTNPSSAPPDGGYLYVNGDNLLFRDTGNVEHTLTSTTSVVALGSSGDNDVVRFDTTDGKIVQSGANLQISATGNMSVVGSEGYSFTSSATSGVVSGGADTLSLVSAGTASLVVGAGDATVQAGHVLLGADGSVATPAFAFTSDADTGLYLSGTDSVSLSAGGVSALTVNATSNVSLGSDTADFAGGQGVVYFSDYTTLPTGLLSNGGILYVNGRDLFFYDANSNTHQISGTQGLGSSVVNRIVTAGDTLGRSMAQSGFALSDTNQITGPDGSGATPAYRVSSSGSVGWWEGGSNTVEMGNGAAQLAANSSAVTASVQLDVESSVRIGGATGVTETFASPTSTSTLAAGSGTFVWEQNGVPIFQTSATRDVDLLSNLAVCTGATGDFSMGYNGADFAIDVANAADSLIFSVGGTSLATFTSTDITTPNLAGFRIRTDGGISFSSSPSSGSFGVNIQANGNIGLASSVSSRTLLMGATATTVGATHVVMKKAATAPTSLPTSGAYLYVDTSTTFLRVANKDADVALNGPFARAKISRTQSIGDTGGTVLIDTLTDVESSVLVVDTGAPGAGTVTGTADTAGWWEITGEAHWVSDATGFRRIQIKVGGVVVGDSTQNAVNGMETQQQVKVNVNVAASAVVTFEVEQNSGGNLSVDVIGTVVFLG